MFDIPVFEEVISYYIDAVTLMLLGYDLSVLNEHLCSRLSLLLFLGLLPKSCLFDCNDESSAISGRLGENMSRSSVKW